MKKFSFPFLFCLLISLTSCSIFPNETNKNTDEEDNNDDSGEVSENSELSIHFIEMHKEYGDSFLIKYNNYEILVDGGNTYDSSYVDKTLTKYVTDKNLDMLIVSHPHADHTGGLSLDTAFTSIDSISTIIDYGYKYSTKTNTNYETIRNSFINKGTKYYPIANLFDSNNSSIFEISAGISLEFLNSGYYIDSSLTKSSSYDHNGTSIVCSLNYGKTKFYFGGDLEEKGERAIMLKYPNYFKDSYVYMKANHHGSNTSNCSDFLNYLNPNYIFISSAVLDKNMTSSGIVEEQHPYKNDLSKLLAKTNNVYWNGVNGNINISCDGTSITKVEGEGSTRKYYYNGSLVDSFSEKDLPFKETKWYQAYFK